MKKYALIIAIIALLLLWKRGAKTIVSQPIVTSPGGSASPGNNISSVASNLFKQTGSPFSFGSSNGKSSGADLTGLIVALGKGIGKAWNYVFGGKSSDTKANENIGNAEKANALDNAAKANEFGNPEFSPQDFNPMQLNSDSPDNTAQPDSSGEYASNYFGDTVAVNADSTADSTPDFASVNEPDFGGFGD